MDAIATEIRKKAQICVLTAFLALNDNLYYPIGESLVERL